MTYCLVSVTPVVGDRAILLYPGTVRENRDAMPPDASWIHEYEAAEDMAALASAGVWRDANPKWANVPIEWAA